MVKVADYLDSRLVIFLNVGTRDEALNELVDMAFQAKKLEDRDAFFHAIIEREKIVSTGIGMGVAIPHAKLSSFDNFFIVLGIARKGLEWNSLDGAPVRVIFMIGGPDDKQTEYLQILSSLTQSIKDEQIRKKLLTMNSSSDIIELFKSL